MLLAETYKHPAARLTKSSRSFATPLIEKFSTEQTPVVGNKALTDAPKILLYSHDTFGLGNIKRTLLLAQNLRNEYAKASVLIITGSPVIHAFRMSEGIDYVKLPSIDRTQAETYEPLLLTECSKEIRLTRSAIIEKIVASFAPDLMIVDKRAAGINGELITALRSLRLENASTKIVLGLRDILDAPGRTSRVLKENGTFDVIEEFYDEVWVYGAREIFDTVKEYDFPKSICEKTRYCGYLKRPIAERNFKHNEFRVLVTTGGGGDGSRMIETYLDCVSLLLEEIECHSTVVFGPQMPAQQREELTRRYGTAGNIELVDFDPDLTQRYSEADVVVSMAGYNTVCELLSLNKSAVLVPRSEPVMEQLIRARLLAKNGFFQMIEPSDLDPSTMKNRIIAALRTTSLKRRLMDLDGLPRINERVRELLTEDGN